MKEYSELKRLAADMKGWGKMTECWPSDENGPDWQVGRLDEEDNRWPLMTVDTEQYDQEQDAPKVAQYYAAANPVAVLELIAEVDSLRDDLEQVKYETNAWRNSEESVFVEVFYSEGDEPFISSVSGQITIEQLSLIQSEMIEYSEDYFEKGSGLYVFRCSHCQAYYDNVGMTEPAHWETDLESYSEFPWQSDGESVVSENNQ